MIASAIVFIVSVCITVMVGILCIALYEHMKKSTRGNPKGPGDTFVIADTEYKIAKKPVGTSMRDKERMLREDFLDHVVLVLLQTLRICEEQGIEVWCARETLHSIQLNKCAAAPFYGSSQLECTSSMRPLLHNAAFRDALSSEGLYGSVSSSLVRVSGKRGGYVLNIHILEEKNGDLGEYARGDIYPLRRAVAGDFILPVPQAPTRCLESHFGEGVMDRVRP